MLQASLTHERRFVRLIILGLILTGFLTYGVSLRNGFISWDDTYYILNNPSIRAVN